MSGVQTTGIILENRALGEKIFSLTAKYAEAISFVQPGQFCMLGMPREHEPYMNRPLAIAEADMQKQTVRVLYKVVGRGTDLLSTMKSGDCIRLILPLGNGYDLTKAEGSVLLMAGGMGATSIFGAAKALHEKGIECVCILGAKKQAELICLDELKALCDVRISTEDGSVGYRGFPTPLLAACLEEKEFSAAYICGPAPMMKALSQLVIEKGIFCQVSLERRMGCGFGACVGCSCKINDPARGVIQKRVCKEGPVFDAREVIWNG